MFYKEAVYRPLGDLYVTVEFGDELNLLLNFRVISLNAAHTAHPILGVTETILPTARWASCMIHSPSVSSAWSPDSRSSSR